MPRRFERTDGEHPIGRAGIETLVRAGALEGVTHVVLRDQGIGDEGLALVLESLDLPQVEELDLAGCDLGSEGGLRLAATPALTSLRVLDVAFDSLAAHAVRALVSAPQFRTLEALNLSMNAVDLGVAEALSVAEFAPTLLALTINDTMNVDDAFVDRLATPAVGARAQAFTRLESLALGWHRGITDRAAFILADRRAFPALRWLLLEGCCVGEAGHAALRARALEELQIDPPVRHVAEDDFSEPEPREPF